MHKYVMTRGCFRATHEWATDLSAQYLPMDVKSKDGKIHKYAAQLQLRPVMLWEIIFPAGHEETVLGWIKPTTMHGFAKKWAGKVKWLIKWLGLEESKIKEYKKLLIPPGQGVSVVDLGNKDDTENWVKKKGAHSAVDEGLTLQENL